MSRRLNTSRQLIQLSAMVEGWVTSSPPEDRDTDHYTRHGATVIVTYNRVGAVRYAKVRANPAAFEEWLHESNRAAVLKELRRAPH